MVVAHGPAPQFGLLNYGKSGATFDGQDHLLVPSPHHDAANSSMTPLGPYHPSAKVAKVISRTH
ncbi:unnamed protein product [Acidithrix sp. C25]|nr:unnamed protein product [Acidithrix sp. C25]